MEWAIGTDAQLELRRETLAEARGRVLELGFGTGLNLDGYPPGVRVVVAIDPERVLEDRVRRRIGRASFRVRRVRCDASRLPLAVASFDTAVTTWTLCTIPDPVAALREVGRVLRPGGRLLFMEHGRSDEPAVARWQERLDPIERMVARGCHLSRPIDRLILEAGLSLERLERFPMPKAPRPWAEVYRGSARRL